MPKLSPVGGGGDGGRFRLDLRDSGLCFLLGERRSQAPHGLWRESCSLPGTGIEDVVNPLLILRVVTGLEFHPVYCS